jgi:hypothetical protein
MSVRSACSPSATADHPHVSPPPYFSRTFGTEKTSTTLLPTPCASAPVASGSSPNPSFRATALLCPCCALQPHATCPPSSVPQRADVSSPLPPLHHQVDCTPLYRLGLRLQAGLFRQVFDIDAPRRMGHIHSGKGAKDRDVPWPQDTLGRLRRSWATHRPPPWLVPAPGRDQQQSPTATEPMRRNSVPSAFRIATHRAGMNKRGVALPPLRHSAATPLRAAGVNRQRIPLYLGHTRRATTRRSRPLPQQGHEAAAARIHAVMRGRLS